MKARSEARQMSVSRQLLSGNKQRNEAAVRVSPRRPERPSERQQQ